MPYVIYVSVDGLRSADETQNLQTLIDSGLAPNFARLQQQGAWTFDARTDPFHTNTLPNHTTMLTTRPVEDASGAPGHRYRFNSDPEDVPDGGVPAPGANLSTIHTSAGEYVPSVFNVVHDNGLSTALYASKSKFSLYDESYDGVDKEGDPAFENDPRAQDMIGPDNGRDKIDRYVYDGNAAALTDQLVAEAAGGGLADFTFLHIRSPDSAGHDMGWGSQAYLDAIVEADAQLGKLFELIESDPLYAGNTFLLVTADHGGGGDEPVTDAQHGSPLSPLNFTIPFFTYGPLVPAGADLYAINQERRDQATADTNPSILISSGSGAQPVIRNGDGGNLATDLMGLGNVPTGAINGRQDLNLFGVVLRFGTAGGDTMLGDERDDGLNGEDGDDMLRGGFGADVLEGGFGDDWLEGGEGDDRLNGSVGIDTLSYIGATNAVRVDLAVTRAQETFGGGIDTQIANENLTGSAFADRLSGDAGANEIVGAQGNDLIEGRAGDDTLIGGDGDDRMIGGAGSDLLFGKFGADHLVGGEGDDIVYADAGIDLLDGGAGDDFLVGGFGKDIARGGADDDGLLGEGGNDELFGGAGDDRLLGGAARDLLTGGTGRDRFVFDDGDLGDSAAAADRVFDFSQAEADRLEFDRIDAIAGTPEDDAFTFIGTGAFSGSAGELRYEQQTGFLLVSGDTDGDGAANFFLRVDAVQQLSQSDIYL